MLAHHPCVGNFQIAQRPFVPEGLALPEAALRQDGIFTRSQARQAGWSDDRQRRLIRIGLWLVVAGPVLRHRDVQVGPWQRARAVHLTAGLVVSHATAGQLWSLGGDDSLHGTGHVRRTYSPVRAHRISLAGDERLVVAGLCVTTPIRTLTDLLCSQPEEESVAMVTDALHRGSLGAADLAEAASRANGRVGAGRARSIAHSCRREPHSVLEWRFHRIIGSLGAGWTFNQPIHDSDGLVGYGDAVHEESRTVVELDSRAFHGADRFQSDRTRDQRLAALGYVVLRFTWADVEQRSEDVLERIRRTIAARRRLAA